MKKEQLEIELNNLVDELCQVEERANLETATTKFLGVESDKLIIKSKDTTLSLEEKELICKQMEALQMRLIRETKTLGEDMKKLAELSNRFDYLRSLSLEY